MKRLLIIWALFLSFKMYGQLQIAPLSPTVGEEVTITLLEPAEKIMVTYRPNSQVEIEETVITDGLDVIKWKPAHPGVVNIRTDKGGMNISVRFSGFPWRGFVVMLLAFIILFGGAGFAFYVLFSSDEEEDNLNPVVKSET